MSFRLLLFIVLTFFFSCKPQSQPESKEQKPVPVKLAPVRTIEHTIGIEASGILEPSDMIRLSFKTGGIINQVLVEEGQYVKEGQVLAKLEMTEIDQRLGQSATVRDQAQLNIERAMLAMDKAKRDLESAQALLRDSVIVEDEFKNAETAYQLAEKEWKLADQAFKLAESNAEIAIFNAEYSIIKAPSNGKILKKLAETNELTGPGMPVLVFTSSQNRLSLIVGVTETDIVKIRKGDRAEVSFYAYPEFVFKGQVEFIGPLINPESATFDVEILINGMNKILLPGFVGNATVYPALKQQHRTIPAQALVEADGKTGSVFIVDESFYARRVPVKIKGILGNDIIIEAEASKIDSVVTVGVEYLFSGTRVLPIYDR